MTIRDPRTRDSRPALGPEPASAAAPAGACAADAIDAAALADAGGEPHVEVPIGRRVRSTLAGGELPVLLPRRLPQQRERQTQSNIPNERADRDRLHGAAVSLVNELGLVPPISLPRLRQLSGDVCDHAGLGRVFADYAAVLLNNESWREELAQVPFERRLLLLPKCLRVEEHCPAPFDQFGMLCKECGLCSIEDLTREAEQLGYAVLIAEGSAIVRAMIETGKIEAIVGVSCLNVLEKCFPHMEAVAIPGMSIPLLQDDCVDTSVDLDQVRDLIHLTAEDRTYRLDLEGLKGVVRSWFTPESLEAIMGPAEGIGASTDALAREWLGRAGKRWRPYLATCMWVALNSEGRKGAPVLPDDLKKLAVAIECFHKASLVHDDMEDGDELRYGEPTLHSEVGDAIALNVGDLLLGEGYRLLSEIEAPPAVVATLMREAARGHVTLSHGQGAELAWVRDPEPLTSLEVLAIFREKTAPAFEVALRLGALYAGAPEEVHDVLGPYSEALGIAYQIRDDVDDFLGEGDSDDLADLRPSLILAIAHKRADEGPARDMTTRFWTRQPGVQAERAELERFLTEHSIVSKARELCAAYEHSAVESLAPLSHATVKGLLRRVIGKIFGDANLIEGYCSEFEARNAPGSAPGAEAAR